MKSEIKVRRFKVFILICGLLTMVCVLVGCDAFVRKFTRKSNKENLPQQEMVLAPEEYKPPAAQEQYRQFFLYWESWQEELTSALVAKASQKRQIGCAREALKNLNNLRPLISAAKQKRLDIYIADLTVLKSDIERDTYGNNVDNNARSAERIKRRVLKEFTFDKVLNDIVSVGPTESK